MPRRMPTPMPSPRQILRSHRSTANMEYENDENIFEEIPIETELSDTELDIDEMLATDETLGQTHCEHHWIDLRCVSTFLYCVDKMKSRQLYVTRDCNESYVNFAYKHALVKQGSKKRIGIRV